MGGSSGGKRTALRQSEGWHNRHPIDHPSALILTSVQTKAMTYRPLRRHATAEDFQQWESKAASMSVAELMYVAKECREVAALWRGEDPVVEGFYDDQASTYGTALRRRQLAAV